MQALMFVLVLSLSQPPYVPDGPPPVVPTIKPMFESPPIQSDSPPVVPTVKPMPQSAPELTPEPTPKVEPKVEKSKTESDIDRLDVVWTNAIQTKKPLVIFVRCKELHVPGCLTIRIDEYNDLAGSAIVFMVPPTDSFFMMDSESSVQDILDELGLKLIEARAPAPLIQQSSNNAFFRPSQASEICNT